MKATPIAVGKHNEEIVIDVEKLNKFEERINIESKRFLFGENCRDRLSHGKVIYAENAILRNLSSTHMSNLANQTSPSAICVHIFIPSPICY